MNGLWGGLFNHILVYYGKIEIETFIVEVWKRIGSMRWYYFFALSVLFHLIYTHSASLGHFATEIKVACQIEQLFFYIYKKGGLITHLIKLQRF